MVERLFLTVPRGCLQFVIVVFPDHTHLLFLITKKLLLKLHFYGIRGNILNWIKDFLDNRTQSVILNGSNSHNITVSSGVPQGTVLEPILFLAYINDSWNRLDPESGYLQTTQPCILLLIIKLT